MRIPVAMALGLFVIGGSITSCSGNNKAQKEEEIPISMADSIAATEAAQQAAEQARLDSIRQDSIENASAGLTFQTFTSPKKMEMGNVTLQLLSPAKKIESNLTALGFDLTDTKQFQRNDYFDESGESYITAILKIYTKIIGNKSTVVTIESQENDVVIDLSINFPNTKDVEEFKNTITGKLKDSNENFWGLDIKYKGTKVTMQEREF